MNSLSSAAFPSVYLTLEATTIHLPTLVKGMSLVGKSTAGGEKSSYGSTGERPQSEEAVQTSELAESTFVNPGEKFDPPSTSVLSDEEFAKLLQMEEDWNYNPFANSPSFPASAFPSQPFPKSTSLEPPYLETSSGSYVNKTCSLTNPQTHKKDEYRPHSPTVLLILA